MKRQYLIVLIALFLFYGCTQVSSPSTQTSVNGGLMSATLPNTVARTDINTLTPEITKTPTRTEIPTIDEEDIPDWISENASKAGMTASEIIYIYKLIKSTSLTRNPYPLIDFLQFPLHERARCAGDVIETKEEFIKIYPELLNDTLREELINLDVDNIIITSTGVALGVRVEPNIIDTPVWFTKTGYSDRLLFSKLFDYTTYWPFVEGHPTLQPTFNPNNFLLGDYFVIGKNHWINGFSELGKEDEEWVDFKIRITETEITMGPFPKSYSDYEYHTDEYEVIEFCVPGESEAPYLGESRGAIANLQVICKKGSRKRLPIYSGNRIGFTPDSEVTYYILELMENGDK